MYKKFLLFGKYSADTKIEILKNPELSKRIIDKNSKSTRIISKILKEIVEIKKLIQMNSKNVGEYDFMKCDEIQPSTIKKDMLIKKRFKKRAEVLISSELPDRRKIDLYFNYFHDNRKCTYCARNYTIGEHVGIYTCPRPFGDNVNQNMIMAMHTDGGTTKYGYLSIPLFVFIFWNVRIPEKECVRSITIMPSKSTKYVNLVQSHIDVKIGSF